MEELQYCGIKGGHWTICIACVDRGHTPLARLLVSFSAMANLWPCML